MKVHCKNPACNKLFTPDKDHRFAGCCSVECQQAITPDPPPDAFTDWPRHREAGWPRPSIQRRHSRDNRE